MTWSDEEAFERTNKSFLTTPLHKWIGVTIVQREPLHAVVSIPLSDNVRGAALGSLHGGVLASLADMTMAFALFGSYESGRQIPVTTDMHIRYLRGPRSSPITADSRVVHKGRRLLSAECAITDADGRPLARATATYMIVDVPQQPPAASD